LLIAAATAVIAAVVGAAIAAAVVADWCWQLQQAAGRESPACN
jgi:hypothetical protein